MATSAWLHGQAAVRLTEGVVSALREQRADYLPALLSSYREHGVIPAQGLGVVGGLVGFCHTRLSSSKTRLEGLCLLAVLVKDSSTDLFQQHCLSWLRSLQQVIQSQAPLQTVQLAVHILKDLLQYSAQIADLSREVGLNSILGTLTSLLGLKTECELAAMEGMAACMSHYPRACGSLRDKLGAYFLSKMESSNRKTQEMACQCYGRLPCLGGVLDRGVGASRAEGWTNQIHSLLVTANSLLAHIYHGAETEGAVQYQGPGIELSFPHLDQNDPLLLLQLTHRYAAVCMALTHTLRADPSSTVRLPLRPILNLLCRALAVSPKTINLTGDGSMRLLVLPGLHSNTLEVLTSLITAVRSSMVPYAAVLQRLFSQTLCAWTPQPEATVGQQRSYSAVRVAVYRTLDLWVQVAGPSSCILQGSPTHSELLFSHLLGEVMPAADFIKLRSGLSTEVVLGGKPGPRRTKHIILVDTPTLQRKGDVLANQDTCLSALRALRRIIQSSGTLLKEDIHKRLHDSALPLCVRVQQQWCSAVGEAVGGSSGPYSSAPARRELYRLLLSLVLVPSPCWPPPLSCVVSILSNGRRDRSIKVSCFCSEALTVCNSILHPRSPSISLPLKPTPSSGPLPPPSQGAAPGLSLPTILGGPASVPPFPPRHSLGLGPASLLGSLENHLSLIPGIPGQDMILSPHPHQQPEPPPPDGQRPVFVRYDKEEAEDVEISLASDSDDSVVIVPPAVLHTDPPPDDGAPNAHAADASIPLAGGESVAAAPTTTNASRAEGDPLSNSLSTSSPLLTPAAPPTNSFPSMTSVVSLVPSSLTSPPVGLGDSLPGRPQLQQMLLQAPPPGDAPPLGLPLQMQQLQNQLGQQGRLLHPHPPPPPANNEDSGVININSTDDEEDEEDEEELEDDEDLEEEGEGDEDDEDEEMSDEYFEGEEYEDYDEDEELEEEEGLDIPPLEGEEQKEEEEEEKVRGEAENEGELSGFGVEGGIEEIATGRASFTEDRMKVQEVESIGVLEEEQEREEEQEEEDSEKMDDPTMPQILCVTGGALEEREAEPGRGEEEPGRGGEEPGRGEEEPVRGEEELGRGEEELGRGEEELGRGEEVLLLPEEAPSSKRGGAEEELTVVSEEQSSSWSQQESPVDPALETSTSEPLVSYHQDQEPAAVQHSGSHPETLPASDASGLQGSSEEKGEEQQEGGGADGEEGKGVKRKREEEQKEEEEHQGQEKKRLDDDSMASMLADFVACPPDDEDDAPSGSKL